MSEAERTVKQRALHEVKEYFAISLYLLLFSQGLLSDENSSQPAKLSARF